MYRYREFFLFLVVSKPVSGKFGTGKSLGTGIGKIWYQKKSPNRYQTNLVPKKYRYRYRKYVAPEKVLISVSFNIFLPSHTALLGTSGDLGEATCSRASEEKEYRRRSRGTFVMTCLHVELSTSDDKAQITTLILTQYYWDKRPCLKPKEHIFGQWPWGAQ